MGKNKKNKKQEPVDILMDLKEDRRILSNVPDKHNIRSNIDRRGKQTIDKDTPNINDFILSIEAGTRYNVNYEVEVKVHKDRKVEKFTCKGIDISTTGILLKDLDEESVEKIKKADKITLRFEITPGSMPEGYEMNVRIRADLVRTQEDSKNEYYCGLKFKEPLSVYASKRKDRYMLMVSSLLMFFIVAFVILMRAESIIYFKFNKFMYLYSIVTATFLLSRYLFGTFYKAVPIDIDYTPGVSILIPCFNEEEWIQRTIMSCINQDYPIDKLEVIVIDDCSIDKSVEEVNELFEKLYMEAEQYEIKDRIRLIVQKNNAGKREALASGIKYAKHDLVVFVDSDSFLSPFAIRNLVQPFKDPKVGGIAGRTDVANTYTNNLTKMQSVRYYISFRIMKAAESYFDAVTCLSGPLACYKKEIVIENCDAWLNQSFLGQKATFGDDRAMTNFVLAKHRTCYQDTAICSTIVPNKYKPFLKQQMRWKRSWLRESVIAGKFMWKKEPFAALFYYIGLVLPIAAPIVVLYNFLYVPIVYGLLPKTFLVGILLMAMLMSIVHMFLRKSTTWIFGMFFCLFYGLILLWQMPIAAATFWKSTWGTRMTPSDILEQEKKVNRKKKMRMNIDENTYNR